MKLFASAGVCALVLSGAYPVAFRFFSDRDRLSAAFSVGYGMALGEVALTLLGSLLRYAIVSFRLMSGTLESWIAANMDHLEQATALATYYNGLSPVYAVFLGVAADSLIVYHILTALLFEEFAHRHSFKSLSAGVLHVLLFSCLYQFVPSVSFPAAVILFLTLTAIYLCMSKGLIRTILRNRGGKNAPGTQI